MFLEVQQTDDKGGRYRGTEAEMIPGARERGEENIRKSQENRQENKGTTTEQKMGPPPLLVLFLDRDPQGSSPPLSKPYCPPLGS